MPTRFSTQHEGRLIEVLPERLRDGGGVRLRLDGEEVAQASGWSDEVTLAGGGVEVKVRMPGWGGNVTRAELVRAGQEPVRLEPEPGSRAARRLRFERERPGLYAGRHALKGVAQALAAVIGLGFLAGLLPSLPLPDVDLPSLPLPSVDLPDIPWPTVDLPDLPRFDVTVPAWIRSILDASEIWGPVLVGIAAAVREWRRRRRPGPAARPEPEPEPAPTPTPVRQTDPA